MSDSTRPVKVRFCPSPTGTPHVGLIRTALFNLAHAKRHGGTMLFRIEDTDAARDSEESYAALLDALKWLGLDWDEGVEVGGDNGPYRQSQRDENYREVIAKLIDAGYVYEAFSTNEEVEARHKAAGRDPKLGYDNFDRDLTDEQAAAFRAEGREPVLRLRMPDKDIVVDDLVRGEVTFPKGTVPDFVVQRANGRPLYTFVNPVDDALMGVTDVLRGEDLLSSTPRQIALYEALMDVGVTTFIPRFGHMPLVTDGKKKLSKRDPKSNLFTYRDRGFIPEGLLNYLALLGWSIAADRDIFSMEEMFAAFDASDISKTAARFDEKKAEAINAEHLRALDEADFAQRMTGFLRSAGLVGDTLTDDEARMIEQVTPLVTTRMQVLGEAPELVGFLFLSDDEFAVSDEARATLKDTAGDVLARSIKVLGKLESFTTDALQSCLRAELIDGAGMKPRLAFGPLRVAISGKKISPPLFESMEILGRERTMNRLTSLHDDLVN